MSLAEQLVSFVASLLKTVIIAAVFALPIQAVHDQMPGNTTASSAVNGSSGGTPAQNAVGFFVSTTASIIRGLWFDSFGDFFSSVLLAAITVFLFGLCGELRNMIGFAITGGLSVPSSFLAHAHLADELLLTSSSEVLVILFCLVVFILTAIIGLCAWKALFWLGPVVYFFWALSACPF